MSEPLNHTQRQWNQVEALFHDALDQPAELRAAYLDKACPDAAVRGEVERLLAGHDNAACFIEPPAEGFLSSDLSTELDIPVEGKQIGRYALKRVIASGGMGTVYEAQQESPRRSVAIKVLRGGMASRSILRRFEHEAAVLAHLRHPYIAQVLEAGTHVEGGERRPFFAMEYIPDALAITDYADKHKLSVDERLKLFAAICDAVHHGHQRGVIHRDLKPANILVDGAGCPKVIDFGVARVLDEDIAVTTVQTGVGQLIGTLTYMSPEQCSGDPHDVDTRSDVYSLGVVFYELLCGRLPYDVRNKAITEVAAMIQDQAPRRLSSIDQRLRGDLETITLKAIEKDRRHRYQTARELAEDIRHYLNDEPIHARPPSMTYQLRMFARRNRLLVGSVAMFIALVTVSAVVMTSLYFQKSWAMKEVEHQRTLAETNAAAERSQRAKAERVMAYLKEMLASANPEDGDGPNTTVREVLDRVAPRLEHEFSGQPDVEAEMHNVIGNTYFGIGLYDKAEFHCRRALELHASIGTSSPDYAQLLAELGAALTVRGKLDEAKDLFGRSLAIRERELGASALPTANTLDSLAEVNRLQRNLTTAEGLIRRSLAIYESHPEASTKQRSMALNSLALIVEEQGHVDEAEGFYQAALSILEDDTQADLHGATIRNNLAGLYFHRGNVKKAESLFIEALNIYRAALGDDHMHVAHALNNLGVLYTEMNRYEDAEKAHRSAYEIYVLRLGPRDRYTATSRNNLGSILVDVGRFEEARGPLLEALAIREAVLPADHPEIGATLNNLGRIEFALGNLEKAESFVSEALCMHTQSLPVQHPYRAGTHALYGRILAALGRLDEAEMQLRESIAVYRLFRREPDPRIVECCLFLAGLVMDNGRRGEAEEILRQAHSSASASALPTTGFDAALSEAWEHLTDTDNPASFITPQRARSWPGMQASAAHNPAVANK